jgi:hypothetical protein
VRVVDLHVAEALKCARRVPCNPPVGKRSAAFSGCKANALA